mmetsp:Transcript_110854/g.318483  ORF Transcript_110854/g.318483 Transcript_110854/m.318483 type:complete len:336 (+) Transcript_110854:217-1224(+)
MSSVQMQACAMGKDRVVKCEPLQSVKGCFAPLKPTSSAKPPAGTRALPVTNWRSCGNITRSSIDAAHPRTVRQNQATKSESRDKPCAYAVCRSQSSTQMSPKPLIKEAISSGRKSPRSSESTASGMTQRKPLAIASTCFSMDSRARHSTKHSTYSDLEASVTCRSPTLPSKATSALPTFNNGRPGKERSVPGSLSDGRTMAGNDVGAGEHVDAVLAPLRQASRSPVPPTPVAKPFGKALPTLEVGSGSCSLSSAPKGSVKVNSKPRSLTECVSNHSTFVRYNSLSTSWRRDAFASCSAGNRCGKPKSNSQTRGCKGKSKVQLCHRAKPTSLPRAS